MGRLEEAGMAKLSLVRAVSSQQSRSEVESSANPAPSSRLSDLDASLHITTQLLGDCAACCSPAALRNVSPIQLARPALSA
jgi:hypothetical protein